MGTKASWNGWEFRQKRLIKFARNADDARAGVEQIAPPSPSTRRDDLFDFQARSVIWSITQHFAVLRPNRNIEAVWTNRFRLPLLLAKRLPSARTDLSFS